MTGPDETRQAMNRRELTRAAVVNAAVTWSNERDHDLLQKAVDEFLDATDHLAELQRGDRT